VIAGGLSRVVLALTFVAVSAPALAQSFEVSTDTTVVLAGVVVDRRQPAEDDGATVVPTALGPTAPGITLPDGANLDAFDRLPSGEVVFSTDIAVAIAGLAAPGVAGPADVVLVDAQGPTVVFSAAAAGLPAGTDVDAVGLEPDSDVLLSFDTTVSLSGVVVDDEDVVRVDGQGGAPLIVYDGSAQGVAAGLDLDGVYRDLATNHLLVSFDGSGSLGGNPFDDEDVLDWNPTSGAYAFAYDGSAPPVAWPTGADLDAVSGFSDGDGDGAPDAIDNCPSFANANQADVGGIGAASGPDGIGDACQCGDVNGNGRVTTADATIVTRSLLVPPTATLTRPDLCNVGGSAGCTTADAVIVARALLVPPTATVQQVCAPALP
jgi:hypothetical protein